MTVSEVMVRPPKSVVLVGDPAGEIPETMAGGLVSATTSCLAVGTLSETDGATTIRLADALETDHVRFQLAFEGELATPSERLMVANVLGDLYLERHVTASSISLQVWVNDEYEPDEICVVIG